MDINSYIEQAVALGPDMTKSTNTGSSETYVAPPEGPCLLRLTTYVETGIHEKTFQGEVKRKPQAIIGFDVFGKNYPAKEINGVMTPVRISFTENISTHEKANFRKLFDILRGNDNSVRHFAQLLGRGFKGRVFHDKWKTNDGQDRTKLVLKNALGYNVGMPVQEDAETGEVRTINVPEALSPIRLFLWDFADKAMWDSLFIDGQYSQGRSKNIFQEQIKSALNFKGSKIDRVLSGDSPAFETAMATEVKRPTGGGFRPTFGRPSFGAEPATRPVVEAFDKPAPVAAPDGFDDDPFGNWDNEGQE